MISTRPSGASITTQAGKRPQCMCCAPIEGTGWMMLPEIPSEVIDQMGRAGASGERQPDRERTPQPHAPRNSHAHERHHRQERHRPEKPKRPGQGGGLPEDASPSSRRPLSLIGDALDMSKIESEKLEMKCEPFDPLPFPKSPDSAYRTQAEAKGLRFGFTPPAEGSACESHKFGDTGLGLSIAKRFAEMVGYGVAIGDEARGAMSSRWTSAA